MSKCFGETSRNKIFALLCIFICLLFASCGGGGGGGGGGAVSYAPDSNTHHNGGDEHQIGGGIGGEHVVHEPAEHRGGVKQAREQLGNGLHALL